jgi:GR25 family glycosyltransferase involved in LPS biosynthesis
MERGKTRKRDLNIFKTPAYVISMRERPERWKRFTAQPVTRKLQIKYAKAVNGKKLDSLNDSRISVRSRLNIYRNYRRSHHEVATLGAVGCSLSHMEVWKRFLKSGSKYCLVMEDDAILTEETLNHINELIPKLPSKWGVWILGCYKPNLVYQELEYKPWNRVMNFTASHAYLMTREAAKIFIADVLPVESHVDHYMSNISILKDNLIVQHPEMQVEFFQERMVNKSKTRAADSNTSQHKAHGCPVCKVPDDWRQIYKSPSRKGVHGMKVRGLVMGQQKNGILRFKHTRRKK